MRYIYARVFFEQYQAFSTGLGEFMKRVKTTSGDRGMIAGDFLKVKTFSFWARRVHTGLKPLPAAEACTPEIS